AHPRVGQSDEDGYVCAFPAETVEVPQHLRPVVHRHLIGPGAPPSVTGAVSLDLQDPFAGEQAVRVGDLPRTVMVAPRAGAGDTDTGMGVAVPTGNGVLVAVPPEHFLGGRCARR